jgi:hypothetical protein
MKNNFKKQFSFGVFFVLVFTLMAGNAVFAASADFNGDAKSDVIALYNYDNSASLWGFRSGVGNSLTPVSLWASGAGNCDATKAKVVSGDFDGDGIGDAAMFYDYGSGMSRVWIMKSNGSTMVPSLAWASGIGNCDASKVKIVSGDYNGDGKSDLALFYDYGPTVSRVWVLTSNGTTMSLSLAWAGNCDASKSKIVSGDYDGDGKSDIGVLYDYGSGMTRAWVLTSNGTTMTSSLDWASGTGNCDLNKCKVISGDYDGDGKSDIALMYDYGSGMTRAWVLTSSGTTMSSSLAWASGTGNCDATKCKVVSGDFDGDGKSDIALMYDYGTATTRIWELISAGSTFAAPKQSWYSGIRNWDWLKTKIADAPQFVPRYGLSSAKSIDVNLSRQLLLCNERSLGEVEEGVFQWIDTAVFSTLVSSGKPGYDTPVGNYTVYAKDAVTDMSGLAGSDQEYYVPNVPWVLWFYRGYSIHGAYWHNDFGNVRSHGCVNVPVDAGAWIFAWAPVGTPVIVHY